MSYEIEMSFDLKKQKNVTKLLNATFDLADKNNCDRHFEFTECEGPVRKLRRQAYVLVFCFYEEKLTEMTNFLKEIIEKYKKKIYIESIYEVEKHSLIYASPHYIQIMEKDQRENYINKKQTKSFTETEYFILRDILKKKW